MVEYVVLKSKMNGSVTRPFLTLTHNELMWVEVIRQASADTNPPPTLDRIRRVRAIFRELAD